MYLLYVLIKSCNILLFHSGILFCRLVIWVVFFPAEYAAILFTYTPEMTTPRRTAKLTYKVFWLNSINS